ncbi:MAG TPA: hypothetical protein VIP57_05350 [Candidatus Dormibacteraeota bacterium]
MAVGYSPARYTSVSDRVWQTARLLGRRGYALTPARLGRLCLGGALPEDEVRWAVAASPALTIAHGLVMERTAIGRAGEIKDRAAAHESDSAAYMRMTTSFVRALVAVAPFIRSVSVAGSLASGGFRATDDVDLNLIVDDGHRHMAYVVVNVLGILHALKHRAKPVDDLTRRPIAPRLMTANLILEVSQCHPLERLDVDMAYELLVAEPIFGVDVIDEVLDANLALLEHFPQLAERIARLRIDAPSWRVPRSLFPSVLDGAARRVGAAAWRYMQWTRRQHPEALARVAFVRSTMRPYTLFDERAR